MFDLDVFAEIMVVGSLLLLGLSPILVRFSSLAQRQGFLPAIDYLKEGSGRLLIAGLVAYPLGVAGNRLIDDALEHVVDPGSEYKASFESWAASRNPTLEMKHAEFLLRERHEATAAWFDRHKSFVRLLRGAAAACALLLLTMGAYRLSSPPLPRYKALHFVGASLLLGIFGSAYYAEASNYKNRIYDLYTTFDKLPSPRSD